MVCDKDLIIQELKAELAKLGNESKLAEVRRENEVSRTYLLSHRNMLNMRGLVELFEEDFATNTTFAEVVKKEETSCRIRKWQIILDLEDYASFKKDVKILCRLNNDEVITKIFKMLAMITNLANHSLRDVIDPHSYYCVVINQLSIGETNAKILKCIAKKCYVRCLVIP